MAICYLCGQNLDPNIDLEKINHDEILNPGGFFAHMHCDQELRRRFDDGLCLTCGETSREGKSELESCSNCNVPYGDIKRKYMNF